MSASKPPAGSPADLIRGWQVRTLATVFVTYATYYFCRQNIAAALPAMSLELGLDKSQLGQITMSLFIGYGLGQLLFGVLGDRLRARYLLLAGMLTSAGLNVAFAFSRPMLPMVLIWGLNGLFQASGFPACAKTIANWFPPSQRGRVSAIRGADYPTGAMLVTLLSGWLVEYHGWRWAFLIPAAILAASAVHTFLRLRGAPEHVGLPAIEDHRARRRATASEADEFIGWSYVMTMTLRNWRIWALAAAFFGLTVTRYGFGIWALTYITEQGASVSRAAAISAVIWAGGIVGNVIAGYGSDVWFGRRRAPIVVIMLAALAALTAVFRLVPVESTWLLAAYLAAVGACTYGPDMMICHTMAMDIATRKATATAGGFIDFFGSMGAALTVALSGHLAEAAGWSAAVAVWTAGAAMAAILVAVMWNVRGGEGEYL
ncbi:MAG: MFS transporter [Armatimonadota bacterium]|nr:MFS transporter [Armatimonadota bacterium]